MCELFHKGVVINLLIHLVLVCGLQHREVICLTLAVAYLDGPQHGARKTALANLERSYLVEALSKTLKTVTHQQPVTSYGTNQSVVQMSVFLS